MAINESKALLPGRRVRSFRNVVCKVLSFADISDFVRRSVNFVLPVVFAFGSTSIACLLLASCASLTEYELDERRYDNEDELLLAMEGFERKRRSCQDSGGAMVINRFSSSRLGKLTAIEYKMARCVGF